MSAPETPIDSQTSASDPFRAAITRVAVIQLSMRAFVCGLFSILPIIGLAPAVCAFASWVRVRRRYRNEWNPASDYLGWGVSLAVIGMAITAVGIPALILSIGVYNAEHGM